MGKSNQERKRINVPIHLGCPNERLKTYPDKNKRLTGSRASAPELPPTELASYRHCNNYIATCSGFSMVGAILHTGMFSFLLRSFNDG
uniref:Uncharacterized protein LOC105120057 n=1 Tax=Rhizophora mucronata TaxID=61149 RepID=A0A2P2JIC4_RHIMU